jgi:MFS family permease
MTGEGTTAPESRLSVIARALSNTRLRRVLLAYLLFNIAEWASWIALLVWAYGQDGVGGASVIALAQLVPAALLAPTAAMLLDRLPRTRALAAGYAIQSVTFLTVGLALLTSAPYTVVLVAAAVSAVAVTMTRPVHNTLLPEISATTSDLTAGNAASGIVEAAATFLGPLVSGVLIVLWGPGILLVLLGVASVVSVALTRGLGSATIWVRQHDRSGAGAFRDVIANPAARLLTVLIAFEYALVGMMDILLVVLALDLLDMAESGPGLLNSAAGIGGLVGSALTVLLVGRRRLAPAVVAGAVVAGVPIALAAAAYSPTIAFVLIAAFGAGKLFYDVASRTLMQRLLPDSLLTAGFGMQESTMMAGLAVGVLLAPLLVSMAGARGAFVIAGAFLPLAGLAAWRSLSRLDAEATVPGAVYDLLQRVPLLAVLRPRVVERLARDVVTLSEPAGAVLVREGDAGEHFFVIETGRAAVSRGDEHLRELGPGDWFGELALLRDAPRSATVTSLSEITVAVLGREPFLTAVTGAPQSLEAASDHSRRYRDIQGEQ